MHCSSGLGRLEAVILLGICATVVALIVPFVEQARHAARQANCRNHLRGVGFALDNYHEVMESYPYGCLGNPAFVPSRQWSCYPQITPWFSVYPIPPIGYQTPSDEAANVPLTYEVDWKDEGVQTFDFGAPFGMICPNGVEETDKLRQPLATYIGMAGVGKDAATLPVTHKRAGMWAYDRMTTKSDVKKTAAGTIHLIETAANRGSWYRGGPATVRPYRDDGEPPIGRNRQFGGLHPHVAMTLFADGSVKPLSESVDRTVFLSMATITADE